MNLDYACAAMLLRSIVVRVVYCFHALLIIYPLPQGQRVLVCALHAQPLALVIKEAQIALTRFQTESFEST